MPVRRILLWTALALAGLLVAVGVTMAATTLTSQRVGLQAEPLDAGDALAPARSRTPSPTPSPTTRPRPTADPTPAAGDDHGGDDSGGSGSGGSGSGGDDSSGRGRGRGGSDDD